MDLAFLVEDFRWRACQLAERGHFRAAQCFQNMAAGVVRREALRECSWCGAEFRPPAEDARRQHCSEECYRYENGPGEWFPPAGS